jgi:hypothetical protein
MSAVALAEFRPTLREKQETKQLAAVIRQRSDSESPNRLRRSRAGGSRGNRVRKLLLAGFTEGKRYS